LEFSRVHEAVWVDCFRDGAASVDQQLQGHELRLQVGREAWIGLGDDVDRTRRAAERADESWACFVADAG